MDFIRRMLNGLRQSPNSMDERPEFSRSVDEALEAGRHQYHAFDPETGIQWQHMRAQIESETLSGHTVRMPAAQGFLKPAMAFAGLAAVLIVGGIVWLQRPAITTTYTTTRGQHTAVTLPDSTEVTLNHTSELVVQRWSRGRDRNVSLNGEAFFHVRRNGTPFTVFTSVGAVQVLGTEFNVRIRENRLEVGVLSGSVRVTVNSGGKDSSVVLTPGQIVSCTRGQFPERPASLASSDFPGWIHGKFIFYRTDLLSVCKEFESQFDVTIGIDNPTLRHETMTGSVDGRSIEAALTALTKLTGTRYRHEKNGYMLY